MAPFFGTFEQKWMGAFAKYQCLPNFACSISFDSHQYKVILMLARSSSYGIPVWLSLLLLFSVCHHRKLFPIVAHLQAWSWAGLCASIDMHSVAWARPPRPSYKIWLTAAGVTVLQVCERSEREAQHRIDTGLKYLGMGDSFSKAFYLNAYHVL